MFFSFYNNKVSITYGVTVCNEHAELDVLLATLVKYTHKNDEIIVLQDITRQDELTTGVITKYAPRVIRIEARLNGDFATFKNRLIEKASSDYLFQIDADELPKRSLLKRIKKVLVKQHDSDCFLVPRVNIVQGLTAHHIEKWKWNVDEKNRVNFPDYQFRILRLNGMIKWENKVHEELYGYKKSYYLPMKNEKYCLVHIKHIDRQEKQNDFYDTIPAAE